MSRMRRLIPILGITFVDILGFSMLIPMLPYFVTHFGASAVVVGVLFSSFSFCQLVSGPLWGNASDRIGRKAVLIISQIGATIGWAALGWAPNIFWVFAARIVEGVSGGNIGVTQAYVADLVEPKDRARAFGYIGATFGLGMVFGPLGGGLLFARYGFSVPFYAAAGLQCITLLLTIVFLPESRSHTEAGATVVGPLDILHTFRDRSLSPLLWQKLALSLCLYGWYGVIALYLARQLHFGLTETDYFFSGISILNVAGGAYGVGKVSSRVGDRALAALGLLSLIVAFALVPFVRTPYELVGIAVFFSLGSQFANTGVTALISTNAGDRRQGTVLGVSSSLDSFSGIVAPPLTTLMLGTLGSAWSGALSLLFATVSLAIGRRNQAALRTAPLREP